VRRSPESWSRFERGEELAVGDQRLRVIDVIPLEERGSDVTALLYVETV
jgi:hypothetical protein